MEHPATLKDTCESELLFDRNADQINRSEQNPGPVKPRDVSPRFIVSTENRPPGKNMKLRKSRFRFGSFAFGQSSQPPVTSNTQPPSLPVFPVSTDPYFSHHFMQDSRLKEESKFRSTSTTSLIRRSNSRVDAIDCSTTPILLAVRKRSCSDSGLDETSLSSQSCSPTGGDRKSTPAKPLTKPNGKTEGSSRMGGGFFRIFNKSATLLFKHPTTELNPNKPYKGTVTTSRENQMVKKKAATLGAARRTPEEYLYYRQHQRWPSLTRLDKDSPPPVGASSSLSSLNSSSLMPLHHHQAYSSGDDSGRPSGAGASGAGHSNKNCSSSSNSVISTCSSENDDCDSGAFSRTSSPVEASNGLRSTISTSALLNTSTASISRLPPTEPLLAPSLVLAACLEYGVPINEFEGDYVDASMVLSCLNAASRSSVFDKEAFVAAQRPHKTPDVSVTIGANTKLTISPDAEQSQVRRSGQLRRSRSGLPVLGTSVLQRTESPSKRLTQRNKISTVYLNPNPVGSPSARNSRSRLTRSESTVTISGIAPHRTCECSERVTVNGQHHCCDMSIARLANDFERFVSLQQTSITEVNSPPETQPNSLIDI